MADRYLLESGSPDGYLLEDGSGVLLLEPATVQWSVSDKSPDAAITNSNLTASVTATIGSVRANAPGTGKFYFEVNVDAVGSTYAVGVADETAPTLTGSWFGSSGNPHGATMRSETSVEYNGGSSAIGPTYTTADVIGVAVDVPNKLIWWAKNNVWQLSGDPALGTGGKSLSSLSSTIFPAFQGAFSTEAATGHFTAASQTYAAPSGFTAIDNGGNQTLTPTLFTNSQTFFAPTVAAGSVTLTPSLFTNAQSFFAPTVVSTYPLTPSLFTNSQTFFAPTVTPGTTTLTPSLFTNAQSFFAPTVSAGAVTLTPNLFTNSQSFFAPTVTTGSVTLTPSLFTNSQTFFSATVAPGGVTLTPSLFTNSQTFFGPIVTASVTLTPSLFTNNQTFYSATVTLASGDQTLTPALFTNTNTFYAAAVAPGPVTLTPSLFTNAQIFYVPTVTRGASLDRSLEPALFVNSQVFYASKVTRIFLDTIIVPGANIVNEAAPRTGTLSSITKPSGQIVNHPPYPAA